MAAYGQAPQSGSSLGQSQSSSQAAQAQAQLQAQMQAHVQALALAEYYSTRGGVRVSGSGRGFYTDSPLHQEAAAAPGGGGGYAYASSPSPFWSHQQQLPQASSSPLAWQAHHPGLNPGSASAGSFNVEPEGAMSVGTSMTFFSPDQGYGIPQGLGKLNTGRADLKQLSPVMGRADVASMVAVTEMESVEYII